MKKANILLLTLIIILSFCACSKSSEIMSFDSSKYVKLCDYSKLEVNEEFVKVSKDDISNIIDMELSSSEAYIKVSNRKNIKESDIVLLNINGDSEYYFVGNNDFGEEFNKLLLSSAVGDTFDCKIENDNAKVKVAAIYRFPTLDDKQFILDFYGYDDFDALNDFLKNRAKNEILFNYAIEEIENNSTIKAYPKEIENEINKSFEKQKKQIEQSYSSFDEYCKQNDIDESDIMNGIKSYYGQMMIYKAVLDKEGIKIDESQISSQDDEYTAYFYACENKLKEILPSKVIINK